jgi:hypothetical protein
MMVRIAMLVTVWLTGATALVAQDRTQPRPPASDPQACAPGERLQPGAESPRVPPGTTGESLSDRLARTDGVICPPNVGPEIRAPAPGGGRTPVIPPPGSGDPTVRPK